MILLKRWAALLKPFIARKAFLSPVQHIQSGDEIMNDNCVDSLTCSVFSGFVLACRYELTYNHENLKSTLISLVL